jgi:uncharacterized protein
MKTELPEKSAFISDYLSQFKDLADGHFGQRLKYLILYGSFARGDFRDNSDIDVLVVLDQIQSEIEEIETLAALKTDLMLDHDRYLSTNPVSFEKFENSDFTFFRNVKRDGVLL